MEIIQIAVLGLIQGLTEFLPVSSSGHLVIFKSIFGLESPGVTIEVILHLGTLTAVLIYFAADIKKIIQNFFKGILSKFLKKRIYDRGYFNLSIFIIIGTIPAAFIGIFFKDFLESFFYNIKFVYIFLNITGLILLSTIYKGKTTKLNSVKSFLIGIAQAVAIGIAGFANVAKIKATKWKSSGGSQSPVKPQSVNAQPLDLAGAAANITGPRSIQQQGSQTVVKAYVVSGEMTSQQEAEKKIQNLSRLGN